MNNNYFYRGMLAELTKLADDQPAYPAQPPKKKTNMYLPLLGGAALGGLGYLGYKNYPAIQNFFKSTPVVKPPAAVGAVQLTRSNQPTGLLNYITSNPGAAAKAVGESAAIDNPALTGYLGANAIAKAVPAGSSLKPLTKLIPGFNTAFGLNRIYRGAANPNNDMSALDRTADITSGAAGIALPAALQATRLAARANPITLAAYGTGLAGAAAINHASSVAADHSGNFGDLTTFAGDALSALKHSSPENMEATRKTITDITSTPEYRKLVSNVTSPSVFARLGYNGGLNMDATQKALSSLNKAVNYTPAQ